MQSQLFRSAEGRGGLSISPSTETNDGHLQKLPPPGKADCVASLACLISVPGLAAMQSQLFRSGEGRGGLSISPSTEINDGHLQKLPPPGKADCVASLAC